MKPLDEQIIIGINDSHDASACISVGGKLLCAASEERFRRTKSAGGFPGGAIDACLNFAGIRKCDVDRVALAGTRSVPVNLIGTLSTFSVEDHIRIQEEKRRPFFYDEKFVPLSDLFPDFKPKSDPYYPLDRIPLKETRELSENEKQSVDDTRIDFIADWLGINRNKITKFDHHTCHAYYAYYASPFRNENVTSLTMDAGGDGLYETVNSFDTAGKFRRLSQSHDCIIGPLYSMVTLILAMRPSEEEFKVMGLAPYAREYIKRRTRDTLSSFITLDGIRFSRSSAVRDLYFHTRDLLKAERFDGIAGGLQDFAEEFITRWVAAAIDETGGHKVTYSGGVAQNVKANMMIEQLDDLDSLYIPPASGDESLSVGACWALLEKLSEADQTICQDIEPLDNAYLGPDFEQKGIEEFFEHPNVRGRYFQVEGNAEEIAAEALAANKIIGVCRGRMEFGPRALGNRSILANPGRQDMIDHLNEAVKGRDFWMPFAPSILSEQVQEYLRPTGKAELRFMTHCLRSTPEGQAKIPAGLHPKDRTARVQEVRNADTPEYHRLISRFKDLTGCGAVLNTSLNIHGKPIVNKPSDIANELLAADWVSIDGFLIGDQYFKRA